MADGSVYKGMFENGMKSGEGELNFADGSYYNGGWKKNEMHG